MLEKFLKRIKTTPLILELVEKLKPYSEGDEEFMVGVLNSLDDDNDVAKMIDYIDNYEDVSYENIILMSMEISESK